MMKLHDYLRERFEERTAHGYGLMIEHYCNEVRHPEKAKYKDVLNYLDKQRSKGRKASTLLGHMAAVKVYYDYLRKTAVRKDHPCKHMRLRDRIDPRVNVQDLFSSTELQLLLDQSPRNTNKPSIELRDKVILSLLVYQALTTKSIVNLEIKDLDLMQASITIRKETTLSGRVLELHPKQIMLINHYLDKERPVLNRTLSDKLILTRRFQEERGCGVHDVVKAYRHLFKDRSLTPLAIRQSVIANLLKAGKDVRAVQVFAGHKSPMTTERYQQTEIEELAAAVMKFHPLK